MVHLKVFVTLRVRSYTVHSARMRAAGYVVFAVAACAGPRRPAGTRRGPGSAALREDCTTLGVPSFNKTAAAAAVAAGGGQKFQNLMFDSTTIQTMARFI